MNGEAPMPITYDKDNPRMQVAMADIEAHRAAQVMNGTLEKSESVEHLMRTAIMIVQEYFEDHGFDVALDEDEIFSHTYVSEDREIQLRTPDGNIITYTNYGGSYDAIADKFFLLGGENGFESHGEGYVLRVLVHELIHYVAKMYLRGVKSVDGTIRVHKRGGYHLDTRVHDAEGKIVDDVSGKLAGLNEAFTDMLALRAIEHAEVIPDIYLPKIWNDSYPAEKRTFVAILDTIAHREQKTHEQVEREFMEGYVNGNMMHLRRIEDYFGKDALKIFALLGTADLQDPTTPAFNDRIVRYFELQDPAQAEQLGNEILGR